MSRNRSLTRGLAAAALAVATTAGLAAVGAPSAEAATPTAASNLFHSSCPYTIKKGERTNGCVVRLQNLLNAKQHAGLEVDGVFGAATDKAVRSWQSAHHLAVDGIVGVKTKTSLGEHGVAHSAVGGTIGRSEVLSRSLNWVYAKTPYSQAAYSADPQGHSYREDCSGFVSMSWHLDGIGLSTSTLPSVATRISKASLKPGDALSHPPVGSLSGHAVLFVGWVDKDHTRIDIREESNKSVPTHQSSGVPLSSYSNFTAYRYTKIK